MASPFSLTGRQVLPGLNLRTGKPLLPGEDDEEGTAPPPAPAQPPISPVWRNYFSQRYGWPQGVSPEDLARAQEEVDRNMGAARTGMHFARGMATLTEAPPDYTIAQYGVARPLEKLEARAAMAEREPKLVSEQAAAEEAVLNAEIRRMMMEPGHPVAQRITASLLAQDPRLREAGFDESSPPWEILQTYSATKPGLEKQATEAEIGLKGAQGKEATVRAEQAPFQTKTAQREAEIKAQQLELERKKVELQFGMKGQLGPGYSLIRDAEGKPTVDIMEPSVQAEMRKAINEHVAAKEAVKHLRDARRLILNAKLGGTMGFSRAHAQIVAKLRLAQTAMKRAENTPGERQVTQFKEELEKEKLSRANLFDYWTGVGLAKLDTTIAGLQTGTAARIRSLGIRVDPLTTGGGNVPRTFEPAQ